MQFGYLLDSKMHYTDNNETHAPGNFDIDELCEKFSFSIPVGLSYEYKDFIFDARYNFGLTKVFKEMLGNGDVRNNVMQFTVGYRIDND